MARAPSRTVARALRMLPMTIADNAGFDCAELVSDLRKAHYTDGRTTAGLDMNKGCVGDMSEPRGL